MHCSLLRILQRIEENLIILIYVNDALLTHCPSISLHYIKETKNLQLHLQHLY
jgi:hypothetical protein